MKRDPKSHKGQNGKVMIIGGNEWFHGAPILCSLGAENSGADLIFPILPACHAQVARTYSLNFIIHSFKETHLTTKDLDFILEMSQKVDTVVIGPGLGENPKTQKAIIKLLHELEKPIVIDASAINYSNSLPKISILTPHRGEFKKLTNEEPTPENVQKWATNLNATIVCKGPEDIIANEHEVIINKTGTPKMTVGGTGDVLSGVIGGLIAQEVEPIEACRVATHVMGRAGEILSEQEHGIKAEHIAKMLPRMLHEYYQ